LSAEVVIRAEGLGKKYLIGHETSTVGYVALRDEITRAAKGFARSARDLMRGRQLIQGEEVEEFWALKDVNFEIKRGDVVGIIGRNGAGKSTLLKILSRITEPSAGRVQIKGRVASLLEVGTGFHPELTGRENIYLNGAILGMSRAQIRDKFDEIVAFSGVEKFLDTPVKRYSSGMYVRLAFAVAAHLEPEILVIDEVLAVGDLNFQKKCLGKVSEIAGGERTVLFVSHNLAIVGQLCNRAICLAKGRKLFDGDSKEIVHSYILQSRDRVTDVIDQLAQLSYDCVFRFHCIDILQNGQSTTDVISGQPIDIVFEYEVLETTYGLSVYFRLNDLDGTLLFESLHNGDSAELLTVRRGRYLSRATIPANFLAERSYVLEIGAGIHRVRECTSRPIITSLHVTATGRVNSAYPGYRTPGKLAPLLSWSTESI
jgi:lipopolysaccharide transport system ATP-binding protein